MTPTMTLKEMLDELVDKAAVGAPFTVASHEMLKAEIRYAVRAAYIKGLRTVHEEPVTERKAQYDAEAVAVLAVDGYVLGSV